MNGRYAQLPIISIKLTVYHINRIQRDRASILPEGHNQTNIERMEPVTVTHWHGGAGAVVLDLDRQSLENEGGGSPQTHSECEYTVRNGNFFWKGLACG